MEKDNRKYRICFIDYMWYVAEIWHERERTNLTDVCYCFGAGSSSYSYRLGFHRYCAFSAG